VLVYFTTVLPVVQGIVSSHNGTGFWVSGNGNLGIYPTSGGVYTFVVGNSNNGFFITNSGVVNIMTATYNGNLVVGRVTVSYTGFNLSAGYGFLISNRGSLAFSGGTPTLTAGFNQTFDIAVLIGSTVTSSDNTILGNRHFNIPVGILSGDGSYISH
jgi:hypothetical protein